MIPKLIMQTWKTEILPPHWEPSRKSIQKYMPDWKYVLMTDEMNRCFIEEHFPDFLSTYDSFPYAIQRCDAVRYAWLYVNGGLYLDCDFELLHSLEPLFREGDLHLLASANTPTVLTNAMMASVPQHPVWLLMMDEMKKPSPWTRIEKHLHVLNTTGPLALNRVVKDNCFVYNQLPVEKLNPYSLCERNYNKPDAWIKPLPGSSWVSCNAKIYHWCFCHKKYLLLGLLIIAIAIIVYLCK